MTDGGDRRCGFVRRVAIGTGDRGLYCGVTTIKARMGLLS